MIEKIQEIKSNYNSFSPNYSKPTAVPALIPNTSRSTLRKMRAETLRLEQAILQAALTPQRVLQRRAAIDVGSGSTKVCIADVDVMTNEIVNILFEGSFAVPYQSYLENDPTTQFNGEIQDKGLSTFAAIQKLLEQHEVQNVKAVATEAFRKSKNGQQFAELVQQKTGIPLQVISQEEEGMIAFYSALCASQAKPEELIIWDIGTGSFQMIAEDNLTHKLAVYMQSLGAVPFKNFIIQAIQGKDPSQVKSPNPISQEDWEKADALARYIGRHAIPTVKEQVSVMEGKLVGIGRLFANSIKPMGADGKITRKDLREFIRNSIGKTDEELGDPFANVNISNAILVLGVMKGLHIHEVNIIETTSTKGIIGYKPYWSPA